MTDLSQVKLGDVIKDLYRRRKELSSELETVDAQLSLLTKLVSGKSAAASKSTRETELIEVPKSIKERSRELVMKQANQDLEAHLNGSRENKQSEPEKVQKKRGRPKKSKAKTAKVSAKPSTKPSTNVAAKPSSSANKSKTQKSDKTLKEELFSIAKTNGGRFRVGEAAQQLVKKGRYDTKERAAMNIHAAIKYYTDNFVRDRSERGLYRVKGA